MLFQALFEFGLAHFPCCQKPLSMLSKVTFNVVENDVHGWLSSLRRWIIFLKEEGDNRLSVFKNGWIVAYYLINL